MIKLKHGDDWVKIKTVSGTITISETSVTKGLSIEIWPSNKTNLSVHTHNRVIEPSNNEDKEKAMIAHSKFLNLDHGVAAHGTFAGNKFAKG